MAVCLSSANADALRNWLLSHEADIALAINDFAELEPLFRELFSRDPQS